jgi:hypothetical protein
MMDSSNVLKLSLEKKARKIKVAMEKRDSGFKEWEAATVELITELTAELAERRREFYGEKIK